jgi:hypothetical protein
MFARFIEAIDAYIVEAKKKEIKLLFGRKYNRQADGIVRAGEYKKFLAKFSTDDQADSDYVLASQRALIENVYQDVVLQKRGRLGTSAELRNAMIHVLFTCLGLTPKQVSDFIRAEERLATEVIAASMGAYATGTASRYNTQVEDAIMKKLTDSMVKKGFAISSSPKELQIKKNK